MGVANPLGALTRPKGRDYRVRMKHAPSTGSATSAPRSKHTTRRVSGRFSTPPAMRPAYRTAPSPCPSAPSNSTSAPVLFSGLTVTLDGREAAHSPDLERLYIPLDG